MAQAHPHALEAFGQDVRDRRQRQGLSVRALAARAGISPAYVTAIELGRNPTTGRPAVPSISVVSRLAAALELDLSRVLASIGSGEVADGSGSDGSKHVLFYSLGCDSDPLGVAERLFGSTVDHWLAVADPRSASSPLPAERATVRRWPLGAFPYAERHLVATHVVEALEAEVRRMAPRHAGRRVGLVIADCSAVMRWIQNADVEVQLERSWDGEVDRIWRQHLGAAPAVDICAYRHGDIEALGLSIDQLATALELVRRHERVVLLDEEGTTTGPAAIRRILGKARPSGVDVDTWFELTAAAADSLAHST
ncbi:MAG: helix-turn-helix transcriptional regulator [Gaiellales bacterium]